MSLLDKVKDKSAVIGVVGLGYVGLPLAVLQAKTGYRVIGFDQVAEKVEQVNRGATYILDVEETALQEVVRAGRLSATTEFGKLRGCDVILLCVPTPLTRNKEPDISAIVSVSKHVAAHAHPDLLVVLESTTYPAPPRT